ncbi:hypothetical protein GRAN_3247 [Granulicella sibirica]|uniref:Uncharacterized protein n=1 Tax=Granulicella sibirica TaxID=2479048 RepID=A0A4Q0T1X4_9BACT|nr:hypothetical protein GRAN_3247 [Granulicella sibirica]
MIFDTSPTEGARARLDGSTVWLPPSPTVRLSAKIGHSGSLAGERGRATRIGVSRADVV